LILYSIFLERLSSWFGISSTTVSWINYNLLNRSVFISIKSNQLSVFQLFIEFLKDPFLVHYSSSYTPLLSVAVISNSAGNHHLYPDDAKRLISFSALVLSLNITRFENTIAINFSTNIRKLEAVLFSTAQRAQKSQTAITQVHVAGSPVQISNGANILASC